MSTISMWAPIGSGLSPRVLTLILALLGYSNGSAWRFQRRLRALQGTAGGEAQALERLDPGHLFMLFFCLAWAARDRLSATDLGIGRRGLGTSLGWGLALGGLGALVSHLVLTSRVVGSRLTVPPEWSGLSRSRLPRLFLGPMLIGSALMEEVAFRGLLQATLVSGMGSGPGILTSAIVFAGWHGVITWINLRRCGFSRLVFSSAYAAALAGLFAFGVILGGLRQATGHLAGGVVVHWFVLIGIALAFSRNAGRRGANPISNG